MGRTDDEKEMVICRCEEVTLGEIEEAIHEGARSAREIRLRTRAGMGLCQGRTCQRLVRNLLARELGMQPGDIAPWTPRPPVRPVRVEILAEEEEDGRDR